jgi:putative transcriptional regulator
MEAQQQSATRPRRPGVPKVNRPSADYLDVRAIRMNAKIGATQQAFANAIGVSVLTLRNWEQRRRIPTGPARVLLMMIQRDPWIVFDVANDHIGSAKRLSRWRNFYRQIPGSLGRRFRKSVPTLELSQRRNFDTSTRTHA